MANHPHSLPLSRGSYEDAVSLAQLEEVVVANLIGYQGL